MVPLFVMVYEEGLHAFRFHFSGQVVVAIFLLEPFFSLSFRFHVTGFVKIACAAMEGSPSANKDRQASPSRGSGMPEPVAETLQLEIPEKTARFARGTGQTQTILAVCEFFSPTTMSSFRTKKDAAEMFGVSPQFYRYEMEMRESGVLSNIIDGSVPPPEIPVVLDCEVQCLPGWSQRQLDDMKSLLCAQCVRPGDDANYGSHGTVVMVR